MQQTLERIRTESRMLHPVILDDFGLENAIKWYVEQFGRQHGIAAHFVKGGPIGVVSPEAAIHIYRIVQEALTNVSRHSGSKEAWVRVRPGGGRMELEIEDRGRGLPAGSRRRGVAGHRPGQHARARGADGRRVRAHAGTGRRDDRAVAVPLQMAARAPARRKSTKRRHALAEHNPRQPIRIVLVDDHALVRQGFRRILEDDPDIRSSAKPATASRPGAGEEDRPRRRRHGHGDAGDERAARDDGDGEAAAGQPHADPEHVLRRAVRAQRARRGREGLHPQERDRERPHARRPRRGRRRAVPQPRAVRRADPRDSDAARSTARTIRTTS